MGIGILGIGISGMNAAQAGLVTTGHNISNASTPGFSRQAVVQSSGNSQSSGVGFIGQGVSVDTIKRMYNDTLANQLATAQAQGSQLDAYASQINQLSNMLGDPNAGLAPALQGFFSGVAEAASHPESISSRQALLSSAQTLSARFQGFDQQFEDMRAGINSGISRSIATINGYAQQIADLNQRIQVTESAAGRHQANDLRDQRDAVFGSLNQEVRASVVKDSVGSYSVFIGNGQPVVIGNKAFELVATPSLEDSQRMGVGYQSGSATLLLSESNINGGTLGGLISFRSETLDQVQNSLGRVAIALGQTFNDQHALGQDLNGELGSKFFSVASPTVLPNRLNTGTASISAALKNADELTTGDYQLEFRGSVGGNDEFVLTRLSDGVTTTETISGATGYPHTFSIDGMEIEVSSGGKVNDSWLIEPTRLGAGKIDVMLSDPAKFAAASPVRAAAALANLGNASISAGTVSSAANLPLPAEVTLTFDAATSQFAVSGAVPAAGPFAYTSGASITFNGVSVAISGSPANGDVFTVTRNSNGVADNRNAIVLSGLQTANTLGKNAAVAGSKTTISFEGAYSQLVNQVGNSARQFQVTAKAQATVIAQAQQEQLSVSGVNLDEEAANLLRYQQAYQASGKMMQIASTLFQTVLDLGR